MARLFVPLDVNYTDDPRIIRAGPDCELVYLRSLALAKRLNQDGRIDQAHLGRLTDGLELVSHIAPTLVKEGLWVEDGDGWQIAAWLKHNPSAADLEAEREAERIRGQQRRASARTSENVQPDGNPRPAHEVKRNESEVSEGPRKRGTRLPLPFEVTPDMDDWAARECPGVNVDLETKKFVDYWRAKTGKDATKLDWPATWKNWIRRAAEGFR